MANTYKCIPDKQSKHFECNGIIVVITVIKQIHELFIVYILMMFLPTQKQNNTYGYGLCKKIIVGKCFYKSILQESKDNWANGQGEITSVKQ